MKQSQKKKIQHEFVDSMNALPIICVTGFHLLLF